MTVREIPGVQRPVVRFARSRGWLAWKMKIEGIDGCPDYWFFRAGTLLIVEFKAPGKTRTVQQERRAADLIKQGFTVHVIDDAEAGCALLRSYDLDPLAGL